MELKDFIRDSLTGIQEGIKEAEKYLKDNKIMGSIDPIGCDYLDPATAKIRHRGTSRVGQMIDFDIAVTVDKSKEGGGKLKGKIHVVSLKVGGKIESAEQVVNRIRFSVPVIFPKGRYSEKELEE